ncbi:MAG TPA: helical backbone metal receptor [Chitinophagaceae bacterium]|nr:helical backbone metal receptor [Chitinophagaceae bacterium]
MISCIDQCGKKVELPSAPERIVSLVPSQTELLYHLGLDEQVAGISKFCVHPESWFRHKKRIGGTKTVHVEEVLSLQPDLIIANKEENVQWQVEALAAHCPVYTSDISNLQDALQMLGDIGLLTNRAEQATILQNDILHAFAHLQPANPLVKTAYLIWQQPYMSVGGDTFIHDMLQRCGLINVFEGSTRYPAISLEDLQHADCQLVLLSSEPYPFTAQHARELEAQLPSSRVLLADGEMFSWYGSRLLASPGYFSSLLKKVQTALVAQR